MLALKKSVAGLCLALALAMAACATAGAPAPAFSPPKSIARTHLSFQHDGVVFAASIIAPARERAKYGVVMIPGSGPAVQDQMLPGAAAFAERGIAAIIVDKRGSGETTGSWISASLDDLAGDAAAAADALSAKARIPRDAIGFFGHSQGGWVISRALEKGVAARFAIIVSGGGLSPRRVEEYAYAKKLAKAGASDSERAAAMQLVARYFDYLAGEGDYAALMKALDASPWRGALAIPVPDESIRDKWRWVATYDPAPTLKTLVTPVFVILGGRDPLIPVKDAIAAWTDELAQSPAQADRLLVLPDLAHDLRPLAGPHSESLAVDPRLWDLLASWIGSVPPDAEKTR